MVGGVVLLSPVLVDPTGLDWKKAQSTATLWTWLVLWLVMTVGLMKKASGTLICLFGVRARLAK